MKAVISIAAFCCILTGCGGFVPPPSTSPSAAISEPATALAPTDPRTLVAEKIDQVQQLEARVEQLATRWPHSTSQTYRAIRQARDQLAAYLRMTQSRQTSLTAQGARPDRDFYRQELDQLDALAHSLQAMEQIIVKTP